LTQKFNLDSTGIFLLLLIRCFFELAGEVAVGTFIIAKGVMLKSEGVEAKQNAIVPAYGVLFLDCANT